MLYLRLRDVYIINKKDILRFSVIDWILLYCFVFDPHKKLLLIEKKKINNCMILRSKSIIHLLTHKTIDSKYLIINYIL